MDSMRKCAGSEVGGCHVLASMCAAPASFDLTAKTRSMDTSFVYEWF
jgi:hypothetical protein